jgi:putative spermidine/putrescine transport system permease protein
MPIAIYGTFAVEIHPNLFAFGVLSTLFSFSLLAVYGILLTLSIRRQNQRASGLQEDIS